MRAKITGCIKVASKLFPEWGPEVKMASEGLPPAILSELNTLDVPELYFYGSRSKSFIEVDDTNSDWDFAIESNSESTDKLLKGGWTVKEVDNPYVDGFSFECFEMEIDGYKVQIVSKSNLELFKDVWNRIPDKFWQTYMCKRNPDYVGKNGVSDLINTFRGMIEDYISSKLRELM